jgi:hypothetical protein
MEGVPVSLSELNAKPFMFEWRAQGYRPGTRMPRTPQPTPPSE